MKGTPKRRCRKREADEDSGLKHANLTTQVQFILYVVQCRGKSM